MQRRFLSLAMVFLGFLAIPPNLNAQWDHIDRGMKLHNKGQSDKALAEFEEAIRLYPGYYESYHARGLERAYRGEYEKAIADYRHALALRPRAGDVCNSLARLQATCPNEKYRDGKKAVENARKALELEGKDGADQHNYLDTLAAAYAECRDFEKAKELEEKAIKLASKEEVKQDFRSRLELYKQGKPYRQEPRKKQ